MGVFNVCVCVCVCERPKNKGERCCWLVAYCPSNMIVYLRDGRGGGGGMWVVTANGKSS